MEINAKELAAPVRQHLLELRHEFHRHPELSLKEFETQKRICRELDEMGVPYVKVGNTTGVLATITCGHPGKTLLMRSDMDALPVEENSGVAFPSENPGVMHACGHDGHMAILLSAIRALLPVKDQLAGTFKCLFQPAEEVGLGGDAMMRNNVMDGVDSAYGLHLWSLMPVGKISVDPGPRMASCGFFTITVKGKSGHGARPHEGIDAVLAASAIVMNLQSIASRETDQLETAVVTIGKINGGTKSNIIAEKVVLEGTTRTFSPEIRSHLEEKIRRIAQLTAETYRAEAVLEYRDIVPPVINDPVCAERAAGCVKKVLGEDALIHWDRLTAAEDMSDYINAAPEKGVFALVGVGNPAIGADVPHHDGCFKIDEDGLYNALLLSVQYAADWSLEHAL